MQICSNEEISKITEFVSYMDGPCLIELVIDGTEPPPIVGRLKALKQFNED
jgi:acetolactate synthase-1/2/3 large subunit